jgi:hypothetical protein
MKRNFVVGLFGGLIGSAMLLIVLSAAGIVGARGGDVAQSDVSHVNAIAAATLTSTFTYQGQLISNSVPINALCDFQFSLHDALSNGHQIGITQTIGGASVSRGLFTALLNMGNEFGDAAFNGDARWLSIAVRCPAGGGAYTTLSPRQALTAAPYALHAIDAWSISGNGGTNPASDFLGTTDNVSLTIRVSNTVVYRIEPALDPIWGFTPNIIGGYGIDTPGVYGVTIGGGWLNTAGNNYVTIGGGDQNYASGLEATIGGGVENAASGDSATIGGGGSNSASDYGATVGGGFGNSASGWVAIVGGGQNNKANNLYATVGGGYGNSASGVGSFVGGGGYAGATITNNTASGTASTIGGGAFNTASNDNATIGGGNYNIANGDHATVGGGGSNTASGYVATVSGGGSNTASGDHATIGGGEFNTASGYAATIPGGDHNSAVMSYTLAAGRRAKANHDGAFVWGDLTDADINSSGNDQFIVRANGGFAFISATTDFTPDIASDVFITTSTGAYLSTAGVWTDVSNKNVKANFTPVDSHDILVRVAALPVSTWNYNADDPSIRHIGPTAQDFYSTFNVGQDDTHLAALDTNGVALAAIQGLYQENQDLKAQIDELRNQPAQPVSFNLFNLLSVMAFTVVVSMWIQQRRSKRG